MMCQIWIRIVVASLILLGESALASESNHRSDAEAIASGNTVQASQAESLDDSDSRWKPVLTGVNSIQSKVNLRYQTLTTLIHSNTYSYKYKLYNSRAPPAPF